MNLGGGLTKYYSKWVKTYSSETFQLYSFINFFTILFFSEICLFFRWMNANFWQWLCNFFPQTINNFEINRMSYLYFNSHLLILMFIVFHVYRWMYRSFTLPVSIHTRQCFNYLFWKHCVFIRILYQDYIHHHVFFFFFVKVNEFRFFISALLIST